MAKDAKEAVVKEAVAMEVEPAISLLEFVKTFSGPVEMRGGFMYEMQVKGKMQATRTSYIEEYKKYRKKPVV